MPVTESDKYYAFALKELRKKHGLIQYTMADQLGFDSQQQYSDLENGKKHFSEEMIIKICDLFHISILEFMPRGQKENSVSFLSEKDLKEIMGAKSQEVKLTVYKKLFLETKIENIETRLKTLHKETKEPRATQGKYKIHVII